jgi:hypothetical protein
VTPRSTCLAGEAPYGWLAACGEAQPFISNACYPVIAVTTECTPKPSRMTAVIR